LTRIERAAENLRVRSRRVAVLVVVLSAAVVGAGSSAFAGGQRQEDKVTLTVRVQGSGSVLGPERGRTCRSTCVSTYDRNVSISLGTKADAGFGFAHWGGTCDYQYDESFCLIFPDGSGYEEVTEFDAVAVFLPVAALTIAVRGRGLVTVGHPSYPWETRAYSYDFTCPRVCASKVFVGHKVPFFAHGKRGWKFARWTSGCHGTRPTCVITMRAATRVAAAFETR
jgi:hypothetical protein